MGEFECKIHGAELFATLVLRDRLFAAISLTSDNVHGSHSS